MKMLMLTKYDETGASSRLRSYAYLSLLKKNSITVKVSNLFDSSYLHKIYKVDIDSGNDENFTQSKVATRIRSKGLLNVLVRFGVRLLTLCTVKKYDVIWIEKELFPFLPPLFEIFLTLTKCKVIIDFDDAVFVKYRDNPSKIVRFFLRNKISLIMRLADIVIVGNKYLYDYARACGSKRVVIVPTVLDPLKYSTTTEVAGNGLLSVGWIGTPATEPYLKPIIPILEQVYSEFPNFQLVIIGGSSNIKSDLLKIDLIKWSEVSEVNSLSKLSIGIMPLPDRPYERGKCAYKILQYMACGVPAIASPVGANKYVIDHNINGYLATNDYEWKCALLKLLKNKSLREKIGNEGKNKFLREYTLDEGFQLLYDEISSLRPTGKV